MTIVEALKLIATVELAPMPANIRQGYDCETEFPLYGASDNLAVVVDGDRLQLEVFSNKPDVPDQVILLSMTAH